MKRYSLGDLVCDIGNLITCMVIGILWSHDTFGLVTAIVLSLLSAIMWGIIWVKIEWKHL